MAFHESFSLNRPAITQVLDAAQAIESINAPENKALLLSELRANSSLGNNYVKSMPKYAIGIGILNDRLTVTQFGHVVTSHDRMMDNSDTLWLLHYFLSGHFGPGPEFWHELCATYFRVGNRFTRQEITESIARVYEQAAGRTASASGLKTTTTIFLGTYLKRDGLGNLGILYQDGDHYVVTQPDAPSAWAFGFALIDDWARRHDGKLSVNLDDLTQARGLGSLFLMDEAAVISALGELQRAGIVEMYRSARPYQLLLLAHDREAMLRNVYGIDDSTLLA